MSSVLSKLPTPIYERFREAEIPEKGKILKQDPYELLSEAIVCLAADDYINAINIHNTKEVKKLEKFFKSDYFGKLTTINPRHLIEYLSAHTDNREVNRSDLFG